MATNKIPTKQTILKNLDERIKKLQDAFNTIRSLPDEVFSSVEDEEEHPSFHTNGVETPTKKIENTSSNQEHGFIKKTIIDILENASKPIKKSEITKKFEKIYPQYTGTRSVTYAITGLLKTKKVKPFKPLGERLKGNLWTLTDWWEGEKLKEQFKIK